MANGRIDIQIGTTYNSSGMKGAAHDAESLAESIGVGTKNAKDLGRAANTILKKFGDLESIIGGAVGSFLGGGMWTALAHSIVGVVSKLSEHNDLMREARLAVKGLSAEYMSLEAAARGYQKRVEAWRKAKAESDKAEADAAKAAAKAEEEAKNRKIAHLDFEKKYLELELRVAQEKRKVAAIGADEVAQAKERASVMKEEAALAVKLAERDLAATKVKGGDTSLADKALELAKAKVVAAAAEAEKVVADAEKRVADKAAADAKKAADEKKKAEDEAEKKRREAQRKTHQERIEQIRGELAAQLGKLDKEIAKAKQEADVLEQNAQRARGGKTFGVWQRGERDLAREQRRADIRQKNVVGNAQKELERLEANSRRSRAYRTRFNMDRIAKLREFIADQDPNNNPALKKAQKLEEDRRKAEEQAQKDIAAIKKAIEQGIGL